MIESEIPQGPRLSLALRARRSLLILGAALGFAAAGATTVVGAQRGAQSAHLALTVDGGWCFPSFESMGGCPDSWWDWPADKLPQDSPPTAILVTPRRYT